MAHTYAKHFRLRPQRAFKLAYVKWFYYLQNPKAFQESDEEEEEPDDP